MQSLQQQEDTELVLDGALRFITSFGACALRVSGVVLKLHLTSNWDS